MERAAADCADRELLEPLLNHARVAWRFAAEGIQGAFLQAVSREGWPPDVRRQTQVFEHYVRPKLGERNAKVAFFLLDAFRFEMGLDLERLLAAMGTARLEGVASVFPTTTPFGMAALVPGADTAFSAAVEAGDLVPLVGGRQVITVADRVACYRDALGDRYVDSRLDDLIESKDAALKELVGRASLIVVRSDDIDKAGEGANAPMARRFMSTILEDVARVAQRLARLGVSQMVFTADHGHLFVPEIRPGDIATNPPGEWTVEKRRCKVGRAANQADGVIIMKAERLGLRGPLPDVALATAFRVFSQGAAYSHEGMSLQECALPVLSLKVADEEQRTGFAEVRIEHRSGRFTSRVFIVKLKLSSLLDQELRVRIAVIAAGDTRVVGKVGDCDARDPATGLIMLKRGDEASIPIQVEDDFAGQEIEVQAIDASGTGVVYGRLRLKNDCLN
jgi:hypothetical protein